MLKKPNTASIKDSGELLLAERKHLTSKEYLPEDAWPTPCTKNDIEKISLEFKKGELIGVNDKSFSTSC